MATKPVKTKEEKEEEAAEMEKAVESYEKLVCACDGSDEAMNEYDATTWMAMMDDHRYRAKVRKAHEEKYG